MVNSK
jgi:hypothetical protein